MFPSPLFVDILLTDTQLGDQSTVTVDVLLGQIVQHLAALTNHHQQATTGVVVVLVGTQVIGQLVDAGGQDSDQIGRASCRERVCCAV